MGNRNPVVAVALGIRPPMRAKFLMRFHVHGDKAFERV
jgi:hypothetical protein